MRNCAGLLIVAVFLLTGWTGCERKPTPPRVEVVELPVRQYVPIPQKLRERCKWPKEAPLRAVVDVAKKRKACLERYEGNLDDIDALQDAGAGK
jgi:hypothetical protein